MRTSTQDPGEGHFVIGVDFGTTFTSAVFAHTASPEVTTLVDIWPGSNGTANYVPSEVHYPNAGSREHVWGYKIPPPNRVKTEPLKWFKLLLQRNVNGHQSSQARSTLVAPFRNFNRPAETGNPVLSTTPASRTLTEIEALGIRPVDVIEDFLRSIRETTLEKMGKSYDHEFVKASKVKYVVTIPAIWEDEAKALMVQALQKAGYGTHRVGFHLVSEPEAAAAHVLKVIQPHQFKEGDTFIICDAGGGTVDLVSYKVKELEPALRIEEVIGGSGGLCGSVYLDSAFMEHMKQRLGVDVFDKMSARAKNEMQKSWEKDVKTAFGTAAENEDADFEVKVRGLPDNDKLEIYEGHHTMYPETVEAIFDPTVGKIIKLVREQLVAVEASGHRVAAVLLVGGFGCSRYLYEELATADLGSKHPGAVQIVQPPDGRTAIAKGALLRGLDGSIVALKHARRSYGTKLNTADFPESAASRAYWDSILRCAMVPRKLDWLIQKGEVLHDDHHAELSCKWHISVDFPNFTAGIYMIASYQDPPASFAWESGAEFYRVCTLPADLRKIPVSRFPVKVSEEGIQFYEVRYKIRCSISDDVLKFELFYDGECYGEITTKFE